jgi:uncharacterized metal-binding protein
MVKKEENIGQTCECRAEDVVLLPCSSGSNCGQIANQASIELQKEGIGNFYCLAGLVTIMGAFTG